MTKLPNHIVQINLDSTGEITKRPWIGVFEVKLLMTHAERFKFERLYNELLPDDKGVDEDTKFKASSLAELAVRIVKSPTWWEGSNNGQLLVDAQPIYDLMLAIAKEYETWLKKVEEIAEQENKNEFGS